MGDVTAREILDAVHKRWPQESHLIIEEAPEDRSRQGRKIDALALGFWQTHGYAIEAIEVKISTADLRKEIKDPSKSDFWFRHSDRFWLATTADVWRLCKDEMPDTWGVLVMNKSGSLVKKRQAPKTKAEPLSHLTWLGMARALRADSDQIVRIARSDGFREGQKSSRGAIHDSNLKRSYEELSGKVKEFEKASGLNIRHGWEGERVGELVKMIIRQTPKSVAQDQLNRTEQLITLMANRQQQLTEYLSDS